MNASLNWLKAYVPDLNVTDQEFFDAMTLSGTKGETYEKLEKAYLEINRILKTGGIFIFIVDHPLRDFSWSKNKPTGNAPHTLIINGSTTRRHPRKQHKSHIYTVSSLFSHFDG